QVLVLAFLINAQSITRGPAGISGIPRIDLFGFALDSPQRFLPFAIVVAAICFWVARRLTESPFGRSLKAMRDNEEAVKSVGKNVVYMKLSAFALSAGLAAVAGALLGRYISFISVESFTMEETIYVLAMIILGGTGNLWGSVLGAVILVSLPELLKFVEMPAEIADKVRQILYGVMLIVMLRFRPQGLIAEVSRAARALVPVPAGAAMEPTVAAASSAGEVTVSGRGLSKHFGGIRAVEDFDFDLRAGTITGLIGPNGAGKTTAFNLITGFLPPSAGGISFHGRPLAGHKPHLIAREGVARSFQDLKLFTKMTVLDNVLVALPRQSGDNFLAVFFRPFRVKAEEAANIARAVEVLRFVGLEDKAGETSDSLSYAEEKLLVIARLLATEAEVLLFDEPLSGLAPNTLEEIFPVFRRLAAAGKTICIIEHNLDVIKQLCDTAIYLDEGRVLRVGTPEELMNDPELAGRYFS
ncbi:MAG: branched-chain amino acid ABC transporter ATP-binding protein/permease, partial [Alphaproteobacteria bacterium]